MSLNSLKRDIARIKRKKGIDFEKIDYEHALARHQARLDILMAEELADLLDEYEKFLASKEPSQHSFKTTGDDLRRDAEEAKEFLGDDNPEMWKKDHATIKTLHPKILSTCHTFLTLQDIPSLGRTPKEMWKYYKSFLTARKEKEEESKRRRAKEKERQRAEMEKKYGKPVRLHPDFSDNTVKYYTPRIH